MVGRQSSTYPTYKSGTEAGMDCPPILWYERPISWLPGSRRQEKTRKGELQTIEPCAGRRYAAAIFWVTSVEIIRCWIRLHLPVATLKSDRQPSAKEFSDRFPPYLARHI